MDRESEFVCLLVCSNLLSFIFSSGMAFVFCFFFLLFLLFLFLCPLKIRVCASVDSLQSYLGNSELFLFFFLFSGSLVICFVLRMRKLQVSSHRWRLFRQCCFMVITPSHLLCPIENDTWASARKKKKKLIAFVSLSRVLLFSLPLTLLQCASMSTSRS